MCWTLGVLLVWNSYITGYYSGWGICWRTWGILHSDQGQQRPTSMVLTLVEQSEDKIINDRWETRMSLGWEADSERDWCVLLSSKSPKDWDIWEEKSYRNVLYLNVRFIKKEVHHKFEKDIKVFEIQEDIIHLPKIF